MADKKYSNDEFNNGFSADDSYDVLFDLIKNDAELNRKINGPEEMEYEDVYSSSERSFDEYEDVYSNSNKAFDDYEDVYSNLRGNDSYQDVFSNSENDIYISKNDVIKSGDNDVYIGKAKVSYSQSKRNTDEFELPLKPVVPSKPKRIELTGDEISDFEERHGGNSNKKNNKAVVIIAIILAIIIGLGGFLFAAANSVVNNFIKAEPIEHIENVDSLASDKNVRNILLIGADKEKGGASRSDSIMIASVNKTTGRITICSILRDTHLDIPGECEAKVNSAYAWGGANLLVQTIEENFGIKIDDYATVNFEMFTALVDGLGGIDVEVTEDEADYINNRHRYGKEEKPDHFEYGESIHLNGYQALWYSRIRKLDSDFMRTQRQRKVITAIVEKVKGQLNPLGVFALVGTAKDIAPYIETTLSTSDFYSLALSLVSCFTKSGGEMDKLLVSQQIPFDDTWWYSSKWDGSSISIDLEENKQMLYTLLYEAPAEAEETTEEK